MDDHFDTSGVFEISKFDISKFACTLSMESIDNVEGDWTMSTESMDIVQSE